MTMMPYRTPAPRVSDHAEPAPPRGTYQYPEAPLHGDYCLTRVDVSYLGDPTEIPHPDLDRSWTLIQVLDKGHHLHCVWRYCRPAAPLPLFLR